jgi:DNA-binding CsgD family transcriptional regulator
VLDDHLVRLRAGTGTCWLIQGNPGLGKTRLLRQAAEAARAAAITVWTGLAEPADATVPYGVLTRMLRAASGDRDWPADDAESLLEHAVGQNPVLICLDDLHWADGGTITVIRDLPVRLDSLPVGWLLAFRDPAARDGLDRATAALARRGATVTSLGALAPDAVGEIAADVLGAVPDSGLRTVLAGAGGNPFRLHEMLRGLRDGHLITVHNGRARLTRAGHSSSPVPGQGPGTGQPRAEGRPGAAGQRPGVASRLNGLSPEARDTALIAASMERCFTTGELARAIGGAPSLLRGPVAELIGGGIVTELLTGDETGDKTGDEQRLTFTHDLYREGVRMAAASHDVRVADRLAARMVLDAGAPAEQAAVRFASGAEPGDERAITVLARAADVLADVDPARGADLAGRAFCLAPDGHPRREPLAMQTVTLLHAAGLDEQAAAMASRTGLGHAPLPEFPGLPTDVRAVLQARLFYNDIAAGRGTVSDSVAELVGAAARYGRDDLEAALALADEALASAAAQAQAQARGWLCRHLRSLLLIDLDRFDEAAAVIAEGIHDALRSHGARALAMFERSRARLLLQQGRLTDAAAALDGAPGPEDAHVIVSPLEADAVTGLGLVAVRTGDHRLATLAADTARSMLESGPLGVRRHAAWLLAAQAEAVGGTGLAYAWLGTFGEPARPRFPADPADAPFIVRIAMAWGDRELAAAVSASARRKAERNPEVPSIQASAAHAGGLLAEDAEQIARAVAILRDSPRRLFLAAALEDLAAAELAAPGGGPSTAWGSDCAAGAEAALAQAEEVYAACGAFADLARVRRQRRHLGTHRRLAPHRGRSQAAFAGDGTAARDGTGAGDGASLTGTELEVARLIADGRTTRETAERLRMSPDAVGAHLRQVFARLGISVRSALPAVLPGQGR